MSLWSAKDAVAATGGRVVGDWSVSGVSIDTEMAQLLVLQNAYAANARVMSAVQEMMDLLSTILR